MHRIAIFLWFALTVWAGDGTVLVVLGIAQDGGMPQAGSIHDPAWDDPSQKRMATCLALLDGATGRRWMFEATPDFREQFHVLNARFPVQQRPGLDGIFLTHAHMGHYTGLMHLGHEAMGSRGVPVYAMPRMKAFLETNGPWSQLVRLNNIELRNLKAGEAVELGTIAVTPISVPHREEYSEVVGFLIRGPKRRVLFVPDIDKWERWDEQGVHVEDLINQVDRAYLDATFFSIEELPGRDMSAFPHPFIVESMARFSQLDDQQRAKIHFIHLNHSNPARDPQGAEARRIREAGFQLAKEGDEFEL